MIEVKMARWIVQNLATWRKLAYLGREGWITVHLAIGQAYQKRHGDRLGGL